MTTLLIWALRIVVLLIALRFILRLFARPAGRPSGRRYDRLERQGGTLVRDPQCGTYVVQNGAPSIGTGPATVYFCSTRCRDAYAEARRAAASGQ